jgi:hypothetical protein
MKRVGDLMKDLGFKEDASEDTARAFIENLVRAANGERWSSKEILPSRKHKAPQQGEQLSFDIDVDEREPIAKLARRSS